MLLRARLPDGNVTVFTRRITTIRFDNAWIFDFRISTFLFLLLLDEDLERWRVWRFLFGIIKVWKGLILFQVCWKFVDLFERRNFELVVFFYIYKWNLKNNLSRIFGIVELISWPTRGRVSISINQKIKRLFKSNKAGIPPSLVFNETLVAETIIRSYLH